MIDGPEMVLYVLISSGFASERMEESNFFVGELSITMIFVLGCHTLLNRISIFRHRKLTKCKLVPPFKHERQSDP